MRSKTELVYRMASADGATQIGLTMVVYDTLAADLYKAASATGAGDVGARCAALNHALLLIGHLQSWNDASSDAKLQRSLNEFYNMLRNRALQLHVDKDENGFLTLAGMVCGTRAAWKSKEEALLAEQAKATVPVENAYEGGVPASRSFAWSA